MADPIRRTGCETSRRARAPRSVAVLVAVGALAATAFAQEQPLIDLHTGDGSHFVLAPTGGPPVVHWVIAAPAGSNEDPPGLEGLAAAVARASMAGTGARGSSDFGREMRVRSQLDQLEQRRDRLLAEGTAVPDDLQNALQAAQAEAATLFSPLVWDAALRAAPALPPELAQVPGGTILHVTTSVTGLPQVARLLRERREGPLLRDVPRQLRAVRSELAAQRSGAITDPLRREVLGLAFAASPWANAWTPPTDPRPVALDQALAVYRSTQHPSRTCNVLTGGFDPEPVAAMLRVLFDTTSLPDPPPPPPQRPQQNVQRRSELPGGVRPAVAVAFHLPPHTDPDAGTLLAAWLAGAPDAWLPSALRARGWPDATIRSHFPFPAPGADLLLIEVVADRSERSSDALASAIDDALAEAAQQGPTAGELKAARTRLFARQAAARLGAANLAIHVAIACALEGRTPQDALTPSHVADDAVVTLTKTVLQQADRATAVLECTP